MALLAVLAATIFAAWFFSTHEKVTVQEFTGYRGEARINDFLAADLLLNELGISADSLSSLTPSDWLPDTADTLFSRLSPAITTPGEREILLNWIDDGGHLIVLPPRQESVIVDEFLEYLDFRLVEIDIDDDEDDAPADDENSDADYRFGDREFGHYRIELLDNDATDTTLSDAGGILATRREWGSGYITLIASSSVFANESLTVSNHARLLLNAVSGYVDAGNVWFVYDSAFPSLWQAMWDAAPYVVLSLATMLFVWLWSVVPRFGPRVDPAPAERRSIIEHVGAAGRFVWRHRGARSLANSSTSAILHEAESRHPGISRLSVQRQAELIGKMTGIPAQAILDSFASHDEPGHREFTHTMEALQRIRNKL